MECKIHDLDEYLQIIRPWFVDLHQLDRGKFQSDLLQIGSDVFVLTRTGFNRRLNHWGAFPPKSHTFGLLADPAQAFIWRGYEINGENLVIFPPNMEFDYVSPPGFNTFTVSVSDGHLAEVAPALGFPEPIEMIRDKESVVLSHCAAKGLRENLLAICSEITEHPTKREDLRLWKRLETEIPGQLLEILASSATVPPPQKDRFRTQALVRAVDYIMEFIHKPLTVHDMCREIGASERTLEYAFRARFDLSPKAYIRTLRLNFVRKELRMSDPSSTSITRVATRWGFKHMGQFAADYRKLFVELPIETLGRRS